jgi:two-component system CheB/CheR fusion protein
MAEKVLNLIPTDIGRSITNIKPNINCPDLEQLIKASIDSVTVNEREVQDRAGKWYLLRIRPYKNVDNRIDGAVISLYDASPSTQLSQQLKDAQDSVSVAENERDAAREIVQAVRQPMLLLDQNLIVKMANKSFLQAFRVISSEFEGKSLFHSDGNGIWNIPKLRKLLEDVVGRDTVFEDFEIEQDFGLAGHKRLVLNARRLHQYGQPPLVLLVLEEVRV